MANDDFDWQGHVVFVGWDEFSRLVLRRLLKSSRRVAVITEKPGACEEIGDEYPDEEVVAIHRHLNHYESFTEVNIEQSQRVFINLDSDDQSLLSILKMKELYEGLQFVAVLRNDELQETFENAGVSYAVSRYVIASRLTTGLMYEPAVGELEEDLVAGTETSEDYDLQQYYISEDNRFCGGEYGELFWEMKNDLNCLCVGLSKKTDDGDRELIKDPSEDRTLSEGDYVLMIVQQTDETKLQEIFGVREGLVTS